MTTAEYLSIWDYAAQGKMLNPACNLCGGSNHYFKEQKDRYGYDVTVAECWTCELNSIKPRMTDEAYRQFYETGAYRKLVSGFHGREINVETLQPEQHVYAEEWGRWLEPFITPDQYTLLDVGGSTGVVAHDLGRRLGLKPTVLDPAPAELEAAKRSGCDTVLGTAEMIGAYGWKFDVVTMCQSIDHLMDPMKVLKSIPKILQPRGRFFVDIVDFDVTHEVKIDHPYNFTIKTAGRYLAEAGFDVKAKRRANDGKHVGFLCR